MIQNGPARSLRDALRAWSDARPGATALHAPGRASLSFAALSRAAEDVPGTLHDAGVLRANIVVCALDDRLLLGALAATVPAGAIFAPVGPQLAREQYVTLLARLHPAAVIVPHAEHALATVAREAGIVIMEPHPCGDEEGPAYTLSVCASGPMGTTPAQYDPAIAYVVVTSGTTARSKLVPVRERQSLLRAAVMQQWLQYGADDVMCHVMPMYFSHGLRNGLIDPLLGGAGVMCLSEADVDAFLRTAGEGSVTAVTASFTFYREVVARVVAGYSPRNARMRFLRVGSGTLTDDEIDVIERAFAAPVLGGYSSTETSVVSHDPLPPRARKRGGAGILVGGAIATLDEHAHLLPQGEPGEIAVRSEFVCDGYLDDDALNVQAFVDGWFRTGDLGHIDADGYVFITGRLKEIINRGGEKISPVEVDRVLESIPGIRAAATFGIAHPRLGQEVVAAIVCDDPHPALDAMLETMRQRLGAARAPRRLHVVASLPHTPSGKLMRSSLAEWLAQMANPLPFPGEFGTSGEPRKQDGSDERLRDVQATLAALWAQVLGMPADIDANFFLAGGDSLCGARLLARIERTFGVRLSLHTLFGEAQNLRDMARIIAIGGDSGARSEGEDDLPPLVARASAPDADTPA